ncbi:MAG: HPr kinase/phosphorylase, partial [Clostridia bacterium]|nr:HPr kinase/phosphorylase [Clostridia bacterium]
MIDTYSVALSKLVEEFQLTILHESTDYPSIRLTVEDVARPGLQLTGFFDHYEPMRLQIMGNVEISYMAKQSPEERSRIYDRLFSYRFPAMLIARGLQPDEQLMTFAQKHDVTVLGSPDRTSTIISGFTAFTRRISAVAQTRFQMYRDTPST